MAKLTLASLTSSYRSNAALNANFDAIEAAIENTLSRDGTSPNAMAANLDMGSNLIVNLADPTAAQEGATKNYVDGLISTGEASAAAAAASAAAAAVSETNAATSEANAGTSASNAATSETNAEAAYDAFDDRYLGSKASAPTLDNDGDALLDGALYWNTTDNALYVYDLGNTTWVRTTDGIVSVTTNEFTGDGSTVAFTISGSPPSDGHLVVTVDGVSQPISSYSVSGTTLTFTEAPPTDSLVEARGFEFASYSSLDLSSYVTKTGTDTLTNKTLTSPVLNGTLTGTGLDPFQFVVATYTALKALTAGDYDAVSVSDVDRGGMFVWRSGNQSANVTADSGEGVWVPPSSDVTGASGAWRRNIPGSGGLFFAAWFDAKFDDSTDDSTAINNALSYVNSLGGGTVVLNEGTTRANIVHTFDEVSLTGMGKATKIAPTSGVALTVSGITGGFGSEIGNFEINAVNGATTGLSVAGYSRGRFTTVWVEGAFTTGILVDGDKSTEFTFDKTYIHDVATTALKYTRTDGVDTGGIYFNVLHITGTNTAEGVVFTSSHTSRSRAFAFFNTLIVDNRANYAFYVKNCESFYINQAWLTGTIASKGMLYLEDIKDVLVDQVWMQNSSASGYNVELSGATGSIEDLFMDEIRSSGPGTFMQYTSTPTLTRVSLDSFNDTASTETNDSTRFASMRDQRIEGTLAVEGTLTAEGNLTTNGTFSVDRDGDAAQATFNLTRDAGQFGLLQYQTGSVNRWFLGADNSAEGGSDAGSDFILRARDDAGSNIGDAIKVTRADMNVTFGADISAVDVAVSGNFTTLGFVGLDTSAPTLTCSSGAVTATGSFHRIAPETGTADDLATINGGSQGDILVIMVNSSANTITVKHGTGNIYLDGAVDATLDASRDKLWLIKFGSEWQAIAPVSNNG